MRGMAVWLGVVISVFPLLSQTPPAPSFQAVSVKLHDASTSTDGSTSMYRDQFQAVNQRVKALISYAYNTVDLQVIFR